LWVPERIGGRGVLNALITNFCFLAQERLVLLASTAWFSAFPRKHVMLAVGLCGCAGGVAVYVR